MSFRHWSPEAELLHGTPAKAYRHDPYRAAGKVFFYDDDDVAHHHHGHRHDEDEEEPLAAAPEGTRHPGLWGRVSFVPYPTRDFVPAAPPADAELVRVFIGQLPYFVTDMQLSWLCHTFGGGNAVVYPERIMKKQPNGERLPTGCVHAYATREAVELMAHGMHKRMLVDDTGVWHAQTHEEEAVLCDYVGAMKADRTMRVPGRPYDSIVVQLATSTYIPRHVAQKPELAQRAVSAVADVALPARAAAATRRPQAPRREAWV